MSDLLFVSFSWNGLMLWFVLCFLACISLRNPWDLKVQDVLAHDEAHNVSPPPLVSKRRPGPKHPTYGIPAEHWPLIIHRVVEQKEPLRTVAAAYGVSHETIRRLLLHTHQQRGQQEA